MTSRNTTSAMTPKAFTQSGVELSRSGSRTSVMQPSPSRGRVYKYFPDVEAILGAWHHRQVAAHLKHLTEVRDQAGSPRERLEAVLEAYALISHEPRNSEISALVHRGEHFARAQQHLSRLIRDTVVEAVAAGDIRDDVAPDELTTYCLHALAAASSLPSKAAIRRLVTITLAGMAPQRQARR